MRIRCHLWGCDDGYTHCRRCSADLYDYEFIQIGRLDWLVRLYWRIRVWAFPRCWHCGRRLWPWLRSGGRNFCSYKCASDWVPF